MEMHDGWAYIMYITSDWAAGKYMSFGVWRNTWLKIG